jgi:hypothetical protein
VQLLTLFTSDTETEFLNSIFLAKAGEQIGRFQVLTEILMKIPVLWDIKL